jgi:hypothetical protein
MTDTEKVGLVDHITRAVLPWRTVAELTECGKPAADLAGRLVTRAEAATRIKAVGQKRAAFSLCMTCVSTSDRHRNLYGHTEDPVGVVARATGAVRHAAPPWNGREETKDWRERERLVTELEAIAALIEAHREEFDGYLSGREQTVSLADRRRRAVVRRASGPDHLGGA